jgi:hypothetical protein
MSCSPKARLASLGNSEGRLSMVIMSYALRLIGGYFHACGGIESKYRLLDGAGFQGGGNAAIRRNIATNIAYHPGF